MKAYENVNPDDLTAAFAAYLKQRRMTMQDWLLKRGLHQTRQNLWLALEGRWKGPTAIGLVVMVQAELEEARVNALVDGLINKLARQGQEVTVQALCQAAEEDIKLTLERWEKEA